MRESTIAGKLPNPECSASIHAWCGKQLYIVRALNCIPLWAMSCWWDPAAQATLIFKELTQSSMAHLVSWSSWIGVRTGPVPHKNKYGSRHTEFSWAELSYIWRIRQSQCSAKQPWCFLPAEVCEGSCGQPKTSTAGMRNHALLALLGGRGHGKFSHQHRPEQRYCSCWQPPVKIWLFCSVILLLNKRHNELQ